MLVEKLLCNVKKLKELPACKSLDDCESYVNHQKRVSLRWEKYDIIVDVRIL